MSQVLQYDVTFDCLVSRSAPITKLPTEVLVEIFKTYAESYPEVLDQRVVDLCLVGKYWKAVANSTPQLWTNLNISFPFTDDHLAGVLKRVRASKFQKIDVFIDFRDPNWAGDEPRYDEDEGFYLTNEAIWVQEIMAVLRSTENRWKSIEVVSDTWLPIYKLMDGWTFTNLPSLESIWMERHNPIFGMRDVPFDPQPLVGPMTLFGRNALLPNLREVSLSAVHVDWNDASVGYQNLRKLEITNQTYDVGPTFEQFAAMLSSSPRLEYLDVSGFCPEGHTGPAPPAGGVPEIPVVHLPALKDFIFGWKDVDLGCLFLRMFQIGGSLENFTLLDTESGFGYWEDPQTRCRGWVQESQRIFEALHELGSAAPGDKEDTPPGPFISVYGVKKLRIVWTKAIRSWLIPFLMMLPEVEDICLEDVDRGVLEDVTWAAEHRPLRLDLRWTWQDGIPSFAEPLILQLRSMGIEVTARVTKE
jgi:hypothetical protein